MAKVAEPRFVTVEWDDAWADGVDDTTVDKVHDKHHPIVLETRGWLLADDETGVSLFSERVKDQSSYRGRTFIPRGMVVSVSDFPPRKTRTKKAKPDELLRLPSRLREPDATPA